jgi:hypothetical protein
MQEMTGKRSAYTIRKQRSVLESFVFFAKQNPYQAAKNRVIDCVVRLELGNNESGLSANSIQGILL